MARGRDGSARRPGQETTNESAGRRRGRRGPAHERTRALIDRCLTGDVRAFETLVTSHYRQVYSYAARTVGPDAADDVAQDVFLRVYRWLPKYRGEASFATWLFRIAHNVCSDYRRRRRREPGLYWQGEAGADGALVHRAEEAATDPGADPQQRIEAMELHDALHQALARLSDKHRAVLVLHDMHGFRYDEIKDIVGCSLGTVRSRLHYARRALKEILRESGQERFEAFFQESRPGKGAAGGAPPA